MIGGAQRCWDDSCTAAAMKGCGKFYIFPIYCGNDNADDDIQKIGVNNLKKNKMWRQAACVCWKILFTMQNEPKIRAWDELWKF